MRLLHNGANGLCEGDIVIRYGALLSWEKTEHSVSA